MLLIRSLGLSLIYSCLFNYFVVIFVVSVLGSELFHQFSPEKNAMFLYAITFPITFIVSAYFAFRITKKQMEKENKKVLDKV